MQPIFPKNNTMNVTYAFRLILPKGQYTITAAASNLFRMLINGELIGYGPLRTAHSYGLLHHYNLPASDTPRCLVFEVAAYRINSFYTHDDPPYFACEISGSINFTAADFEIFRLTDRIIKVPRYSFQRGFSEAYTLLYDRTDLYKGKQCSYPHEQAISVEGIIFRETDLPLPRFTTETQTNVIESGDLISNPHPYHMRDRSMVNISSQFKGYTIEELECNLPDEAAELGYRKTNAFKGSLTDGYVLYALNRNRTGFIGLEITANTDCTVFLTFDEILWLEAKKDKRFAIYFSENELPLSFFRMECCNVVKLNLKPGHYRFMTFEAYTLQYCKLSIKGSAYVHKLTFTDYENSEAVATFSCADEQLNAIFNAAVETFRQNAVDILTDCPSRERAGWLCDSYFSARAEWLLTGSNVIEKNLLTAYLHAPDLGQIPSAMFPMCYPADHPDGVYIPNWAMFLLLELEEYLNRTNDRQLIDDFRQKIYSLIDYFELYINEYGLLENLDGWVFVEWSQANNFTNGINFPSNMLYARALQAAAELYGDKRLLIRAQAIRKSIRKFSFNGEFFEDNCIRENGRIVRLGNITETCQYYAFYLGIADKKNYSKLYHTLIKEFGYKRSTDVYPHVFPSNAFIGNFMRLDWLIREGEYMRALDECRSYFYRMAVRTGTLWENNDPLASCNHGFASYAAMLLLHAVIGYSGIDSDGTPILLHTDCLLDCNVQLPTANGQLIISRKNGILNWTYSIS